MDTPTPAPPEPPATPGVAEPRPTLLVFTLGAAAEGRRRRLLPQALRDRETALYRACLDEALTAGRACGFRLAVSAPGAEPHGQTADIALHEQGEGGFGDRLAAAFDAAGPAPGAPVMVVGTDTPGLTADRLRRAALALVEPPAEPASGPAAGRVVIGPSPDGGLYLLAADRPLGDLLRGVPWRRRRTLAALTRELERVGLAVHLLPPLADLDRPADLDGWLAGYRRSSGAASVDRLAATFDRIAATFHRIAAALARLLAALRRPLALPRAGTPRPAVVPVRAGRAPPRPSR